MKGDLTFMALEILLRGAYVLEGFFLAFTMPYGTSMGRAMREVERHVEKREQQLAELRQNFEKYRQLHNLIYRLKREGLIEERPNRILRLTAKGKQKLEFLRKRRGRTLPPPHYAFEKGSGELYVFTFDIPEREWRKRRWLRLILADNGFRILHKSVWIGNKKPSRDFIEDLADLGLIEYIHIFAISRRGTISQWPARLPTSN